MKYLAPLVAAVLLPIAALAQGVVTLPPVSTITFNPGSAQSTVNGQMAPGGTDLYYVRAKAGQTMSESVTSATPGVSFRVYRPDTTLAKAADGRPLIEGKTLPDAGPADNAQAWVGAIPHHGNYLIMVGMAPGGPLVATPYALTVALQ